jgi:hypothetical protein
LFLWVVFYGIRSQKFGATSSHRNSCVLILTKMGWDEFCAIFFTNSSGHPDFKSAVNLSSDAKVYRDRVRQCPV